MLLMKRKKIKTLLFSLSAGILLSCGKDDSTTPPVDFLGEIDFIKTFGGSDEDAAIAVVQSNDGDYIVLGSTKSTDGDLVGKIGNDSDYWLLKLSQNGEKVWSKTYGGSEDDVATNLTKTSDGGYVISGHSRSIDGDVTVNAGFQDYWLVKVNSTGAIQWEKSFGFSGSDQAYKIFETAEGNYFVTGFFDVSASGGEGNDFQNGNPSNELKNPQHGVGEYWGILMDSNGNNLWRRYFGGTNNDRSYDALQTNDGGFLMVGQSESFDYDITDDKGSYDFWAVRLSPSGEKLWTKSFGGSEIEIGYAVTKSNDGNYIMVGDTRSTDQDITTSHGNADAWAVKFDDNGNKIWQKTYGGSSFDSARSIQRINDGKYLISGSTRSADGDLTSNNGENDTWVFIIDENGNMTFETTVGGSRLDFGNSAIQTSDNKIIVVGNTESNDIDIPLNRGIKDFIILKLK